MNLFKIMQNTIERPLRVDLLFSTESKSVKAHGASYMGKDRFYKTHAVTVDLTPLFGIYLFDHLLAVASFDLCCPAVKEGHLSGLCIRVPHTFRP